MTVCHTLLVPVKLRSREFDAKLLLACFGAERGFTVVIGSRMDMFDGIHKLPVGLCLTHGVRYSRAKMLHIMRNLGHDLVGWDEAIDISGVLRTYRFSRITTSCISRFFAWGDADGEIIATVPEFRGIPVEATGNPRADLLRPELRGFFREKTDKLTARYGRFILVNSNFAALNPVRSSKSLAPSRIPQAKLADYVQMVPTLDFWCFRENMFDHFRRMLPQLANAFPKHKVILRPHPDENPEIWLGITKNYPNVTIIRQGPIVPWLLAAEVVIHNGCTTGLEAFLLERPVICYSPITNADYGLELYDKVSDIAVNFVELRALIAHFLAGGRPQDLDGKKRALAAHHTASLEGPLACTRILDALERHMAENPLPVIDPATRKTALRQARWRGFISGKLLPFIPGDHKTSRSYRRHRFPDITCSQVNRHIERFSRTLGRFDGIKAESMSRNIFRIS